MNPYRRQFHQEIERSKQRWERNKRIALLAALAGILLFAMCSCAFATGNGTGYTFTALGTDLDDVEVTATSFKAKRVNNSTAFNAVLKQVRAAWQSYLALQGLEFISGRYFDQQGQEIASSQAVKLEELRNAKDIEMANLKLEELKLLEAAAPAP